MGDAPQSTPDVIERHCHRSPLPPEIVQCVAKVISQLEVALGPSQAQATPQYATLLRLLRAHTKPLPNNELPFVHFQGHRLRVFTKNHIEHSKQFPVQLVIAIRDGKVPGYPPETLVRLPKTLIPQNVDLSSLKRQNVALPWDERRLPVDRSRITTSRMPLLDTAFLSQLRSCTVRRNMTVAKQDIHAILDKHYDGVEPLDRPTVLLLEARIRHINLWARQCGLRRAIWEENLLAEREGRRGTRARARVMKSLYKEYDKVERARRRREEMEGRERRKMLSLYLGAFNEHTTQFKQYHRDVVRRGIRFMVKAVTKYHEEVSRHASRAEREAEKARIQKLREDDEEGYLELLKQTKNVRLRELLDQTDRHLRELGSLVKEERAKSGIVEYEMKDAAKATPAKRAYFETAHAIKETVEEQPRMLVGGTLKGYQLQGIQWMVSLYNNRLNGILADEMGLGKTIQTIGLIAYLMELKHNRGPFLIVVPLSTMSNWELEFAHWCPSVRIVTFKGDRKKRKKIFDTIIAQNHFNVCLVTYEYVVLGKNFLRKINWEHIIIDEGQRLKNHESKLAVTLSKQYTSRSRLLLTGTPLQNSLTELWALLNFLLPNIFNSSESFESWFAAPFASMGVGDSLPQESTTQLTEEESLLIIRRLHQVLRPFLLRRLKADVLRRGEQLPSKSEHIIMCDMSSWQKYTYYRIAKQQKILYADSQGKLRYGSLPNPAMQMKKCCNHPYLFFASNPEYNLDCMTLCRSSGKFALLDSVLMKLLRTNHRMLVFNQMKRVVHLQERILEHRNIPYLRLDGSTSPDERKRMVAEFNSPVTSYNVFLLTTRAGGLGVNLQTADTVIIFDSDWNPQMDLQAQDRAHRIGQEREVLVLRFLTAKSVEEMIIERATYKRGLEQKIIRAGMFDENAKDSERQALLRELLRIEEAESEGDDSDGNVPTDEEINQIISRSPVEEDIFAQIDKERAAELGNRAPLTTEEETPEFAVEVPDALLHATKAQGLGIGLTSNNFEEVLKPRNARKQGISYAVDRLSDAQYIRMIEMKEQGLPLEPEDGRSAAAKLRRKRGLSAVEKSTAAIDDEFFGIDRNDDDLLLEGKDNETETTKDVRMNIGAKGFVPQEESSSRVHDSKTITTSIGNKGEITGSAQKRVIEDNEMQPKRKRVRMVIEDEDESEIEVNSLAGDTALKSIEDGSETTAPRESSLAIDTDDIDGEEAEGEEEDEEEEGEDSEDESEEQKKGEPEEDDEEEGVVEEHSRELDHVGHEYDSAENIAQDIGIHGIQLDDHEEGQILTQEDGDQYLNETYGENDMDVGEIGEIGEIDDGEIREDGELADAQQLINGGLDGEGMSSPFTSSKGLLPEDPLAIEKPLATAPVKQIDKQQMLDVATMNGLYDNEEGEIVEDREIADDGDIGANVDTLQNGPKSYFGAAGSNVSVVNGDANNRPKENFVSNFAHAPNRQKTGYDQHSYGVDEGEIAEAVKANGPRAGV